MNNRIKELRTTLKFSQKAFGARLGVTDAAISSIESGRRNLTEQMEISICREFNVNETWLRTGEGEMFKKTPDSIAGQLSSEFGLDEFLQGVVTEYLKLNAEQRKTVRDFVSSIASEIPPAAPAFAPAHTPTIEGEARAEAEEYYRQILAEKERAAKLQVSPNDSNGSTPKMA